MWEKMKLNCKLPTAAFAVFIGILFSPKSFAGGIKVPSAANANECMGLFIQDQINIPQAVLRVLNKYKLTEAQFITALKKGPVIPASEVHPSDRQSVYFRVGNNRKVFEATVAFDEKHVVKRIYGLKVAGLDSLDFDDLMEIHLIQNAPIEEIEQELRDADVEAVTAPDRRAVIPIARGLMAGKICIIDELLLILKEASIAVNTHDLQVLLTNVKATKTLKPADANHFNLRWSEEESLKWFVSPHHSNYVFISFNDTKGFIEIINLKAASKSDYRYFLEP